jgi:hypothetical protein
MPHRVVPLFVIPEVDGFVHRGKCAHAEAVDNLVILRDGRDGLLKVCDFEPDLLLLLPRLEVQSHFLVDIGSCVRVRVHATVSIIFIAIFSIVVLLLVAVHVFIQVNEYFGTHVPSRDVLSLRGRPLLEKSCDVSLIVFEVRNLEIVLWLVRVTLVSSYCPSFAICL